MQGTKTNVKMAKTSKAKDESCENGPLSAYAKDFYLKEYESLRREIEIMINDYRSTERNIVIAVGVSWGWLYGFRDKIPLWAWMAPCLFVVLGMLRHLGNEKSFRSVHEYVTRVEQSFAKPGHPGGWEHAPEAEAGRCWTKLSAWSFWAVLLTATALVAWFGMHKLL